MKLNEEHYRIGLDAGSTTLKLVATNSKGDVVYTAYNRHHADIPGTLQKSLHEMRKEMDNISVSLCTTGSAGMGLSERYGLKTTFDTKDIVQAI